MVDHHVISARAIPGDAVRWQDLAVGDRIPDWGPGDPHFEARYGGGAIDAATVWLLGRGLNERLE